MFFAEAFCLASCCCCGYVVLIHRLQLLHQLLPLLLPQEMTCAFLRAVGRNPSLRDLARLRFVGCSTRTADWQLGCTDGCEGREAPTCLKSMDLLGDVSTSGSSWLSQEFGLPFDLLHFINSGGRCSFINSLSPAAAEALLAYDFPLVILKPLGKP